MSGFHIWKPSQSSLRDASSPEGESFLHLPVRAYKSSPFGGAGASAPERVLPVKKGHRSVRRRSGAPKL